MNFLVFLQISVGLKQLNHNKKNITLLFHMPTVKYFYLLVQAAAAAPSTDSAAETTESSSIRASRPAPC